MKGKIHYGWIICIACTLMMLCCSGMVINAFSAYLPSIVEQYGLTQTQASLITTIRSFSSLIFKFVVLWFINRIGVRRTMMIGAFCTSGAFLCYGFGHSVFAIYAAAALTGAGYGMATMVPISIILNKWFEQKLAIAVAVCAASTGVSAMIFPTMITKCIQTIGLSTTFIGQSILMFVLCMIAVLILRNTPEEIGLEPFGRNMKAEEKKKAKSISNIELQGLHKILFYIAPLLLGAVTITLPSLFTLHFTTLGFDAMTAALGVSAYGFTMLIGKFAYGFFSDLIGNAKTNYIFIMMLIIGCFAGCVAKGSTLMLLLSSGIIGLGCALSTVGITMWAKDFSSAEGYAETVRTFQILTMVGTLFASPLAGVLADTFGNYVTVFALFGIMSIVIMIVIISGYRAGAKANA